MHVCIAMYIMYTYVFICGQFDTICGQRYRNWRFESSARDNFNRLNYAYIIKLHVGMFFLTSMINWDNKDL